MRAQLAQRKEVTRERYVKYATEYFAVYYSNFHKDFAHFVADVERSIPRAMMPHYFDVVILKNGEIREIVGLEGGTEALVSNTPFVKGKFSGISKILDELQKMGYAKFDDGKWYVMVT